MPKLDRRLQLLLDPEQHARLKERSDATGRSVGALIRDAVEESFGGGPDDRDRAGAILLAAEPMAVADWPEMKSEISGTAKASKKKKKK